jgi:chaperonin GroES
MKVLKDRVALQLIAAAEKTEGGIIIPEKSKEIPVKAKVCFVGKDVKDVEVGNMVFFHKWSGNEIEVNKQKYLICKESEILCVIDEH